MDFVRKAFNVVPIPDNKPKQQKSKSKKQAVAKIGIGPRKLLVEIVQEKRSKKGKDPRIKENKKSTDQFKGVISGIRQEESKTENERCGHQIPKDNRRNNGHKNPSYAGC